MEELNKKREELEKNLKRKEAAHYGKPYWHSEGSYRDSVKEIRCIYEELFKVSQEIGSPIPVWF
tara:strand:+ start:339 stop:530 length:192 start_codon:yes stop_codon:yes gene_type:complete